MMQSQPWITYFKQTVGAPLEFSSQTKPVIIKNSGNSKPLAAGQNKNLPIEVISPLEQTNNMAIAQIKSGKSDDILTKLPVSRRKPSKKEVPRKGRGSKPKSSKTGKGHSSATKSGKSAKSTSHQTKKATHGKTVAGKPIKGATRLGPKGAKLPKGPKGPRGRPVKQLTLSGAKAKDIFSQNRD